MTYRRWMYWLFLAATAGAVLIALLFTALGWLLAVLWEGGYRLYRRWALRPSGV